MNKKLIKVPKGFFKKLKCDIKIPTIKCAMCGQKVLDTPSNRIRNWAFDMIKIK